MKTADFELELKAIDPDIRLVPHPSNADMAGVYYKHVYLFACPNGDILPTRDGNYKNSEGHVHRSAEEVRAMTERWIWRFKNEPGFAESEMEPV